MAKGDRYPSEMIAYKDQTTGVPVFQMTDYNCNSYLPYFTSNTWYDGGKKIVFGSDRENASNYYSLDITTGEIQQLTNFTTQQRHQYMELVYEMNPHKEEMYFWHGLNLWALDLRTLEQRVIFQRDADQQQAGASCCSDGKSLLIGLYDDLSVRLGRPVSFEETWKAKPHSRIISLDIATGAVREIFQEDAWITHVNPSPTRPNLMTYCHEGPWDKVEQRIWGLWTDTGENWVIRPKVGDDRFGHEFWLPDGETLGYHGWNVERGVQFFGKIRYDNTEYEQAEFPQSIHHIHHVYFHDWNGMMVADSFAEYPHIRIWRNEGGKISWPRILCEHRSSFHFHPAHAHPRFTPDGKKVLFTSNRTGYCNIYMLDVPDFESLPLVEE